MTQPDEADEILCACVGLGRKAATSRLATAPGQSFDAFLAATGAGQVCTACMLDLEHFFVEAPRAAPTHSGAPTETKAARRSFKQRVYGFLDRLSPPVATNRTNWMPVLHGAGVEQFLWVSNHALLYQRGSGETDFRIAYQIRDTSGRIVLRARETLPVDGMLRLPLSQHLPPAEELTVGSVAVDRVAVRPGVRGTTRPQVEIVTASAAASLHFQAPNRGYRKSVSFHYRPTAERIFFTAVNCADAPFSLSLSYRLAETGNETFATADHALGPFEGRLIEAKPSLPAGRDEALVTADLRSSGYGKLHLLIASPDLSRLSLDHL
ncbi:MAG: hypothetical protein R3F55_23815 [Alphaproteobacteria bacterium]